MTGKTVIPTNTKSLSGKPKFTSESHFHVDLVPGGTAEPAPPDPIYRHPSSPNYGANWTRETVVFDNIKLSNKTSSSSASGEGKKIALNSLHRYEPRVHVIKFSDPGREEGNVKRVEWDFVQSFPPARFITVTAYQNEDVTGLKVKYNRYAKGKSKNGKAKEAVADVNARDRITYKKRSFALDQFHDVCVNTDPNLNQNSQPKSGQVFQPSVPNGNQLAPTPSTDNMAANNSSWNLSSQSSSASSTRYPPNPIVPCLPQQPLKPRAPLGWDIAKPDPEQEPEPVSGL